MKIVLCAIAILATMCHVVNAKLYVSLTFDDGWDEHYDLSHVLDTYNIKGTFYVNSGRTGTYEYMPANKFIDIQSRGHEIAGHTLHHLNLTALNDTERVVEICDDHALLTQQGLYVSNFAFPFSAVFNGSDAVVQYCNYSSARVSGGIWTPFSCSNCRSGILLPLKNLPETSLFHLRSASYRSYMHSTALISMIDRGLNTSVKQDLWMIFVFHRIANFTNPYSTMLYYSYDQVYLDDTFNSTVSIITYTDLVTFLDHLTNTSAIIKRVEDMIGDGPTTNTTTTVGTTPEPPSSSITTTPSSSGYIVAGYMLIFLCVMCTL